jgi:hypothetical protein
MEESPMRTILMTSLSLLFVVSCSGKDDEPDDTGVADADTDTGAVGDIVPSTGTWHLNDATYSVNTCGVDETSGEDPEGTWTLSLEDDGSYSLSPAAFLGSFSCRILGKELGCDQLFFEDIAHEVLDAVLDQTFNMGMSFSDENTALGFWGIVQTCEGTECDGLDCEVQASGNATYAGE